MRKCWRDRAEAVVGDGGGEKEGASATRRGLVNAFLALSIPLSAAAQTSSQDLGIVMRRRQTDILMLAICVL